jgi:hypothetical protein
MTASEVVRNVRITDVYQQLSGGARVRRGRAKAAWRGGKDWNVHLYDDSGRWVDFARGDKGDVLDLIVRFQGCTRSDALRWLADMIGSTLDDRPSATRQALADSAKIAADAAYFADAALILAEEQLEKLAADDPERREWNRLVRELRVSPEGEYRAWWRNGHAEMAAALVGAGRERSRRIQAMLAGYLTAELVNGA